MRIIDVYLEEDENPEEMFRDKMAELKEAAEDLSCNIGKGIASAFGLHPGKDLEK